MGQRGGYCPTCKRDGLTAADFPQSAKGYTHDVCLACEREKNQRYRDEMKRDPARLARHLARERARQRRVRQQRKWKGMMST